METLISIFRLLLCILLQVLFFNRLQLWGGVVFIYLIGQIKIPFQINRSVQILIGFLTGLIVDVFCNTLGLHAITCTLVMWLRLPMLHMFIVPDDTKAGVAGFSKLGVEVYIRHLVSIILLHSIVFYSVEAITLFSFISFIVKLLLTILLTFVFACAVEFAMMGKRNN